MAAAKQYNREKAIKMQRIYFNKANCHKTRAITKVNKICLATQTPKGT